MVFEAEQCGCETTLTGITTTAVLNQRKWCPKDHIVILEVGFGVKTGWGRGGKVKGDGLNLQLGIWEDLEQKLEESRE
jgi:hypothetical protein